MKTLVRVLGASLALGVVAACTDPLSVKNLQGPDIERVLSSGTSIESVISGNYLSCRNNAINSNAFQQMQTMSFETASSLNNFNMGPVSGIPRSPLSNTKATQTLGGGTFNTWSSASRSAANAVAALDRLTKSGGTIGTTGADLRARAFGFFDIACNLGYLAMTFDSAAVVNHLMSSDSIPGLVGYPEVAQGALDMLDSAIAVANLPAAAAGFPTPTGNAWMNSTALSKDLFVRLMRSWKARIRAQVARTKAERDAVNWAAVIADAEAGINQDITVGVGGSTGWGWNWQGLQSIVEGWQQLTFMILGQADTSRAWDAWLALGKSNRPKMLVLTPDKRWPQGANDVAQVAASTNPTSYTSMPYIQNYQTNAPLEAWAQSNYRWQRFRYYQLAGNIGTVPEFLKAEVDLLAAEGYIRTGNIPAATAKIDISRVRAGLPALTGVVTTATQLIPGSACVPRKPDPSANYTTTTCGDVMEAMKYEKRMELAMERLGAWFYDSRGWQDLYEGTPLYYPMSVDEIDARYQLTAASRYYNIGGGGVGSAPKSLYYGFEAR